MTVLWGRALRSQDSLIKALFADAWASVGPLRQLLIILVHGRQTRVTFSEPVSLRRLIDEETDASAATRMATRFLRFHFRRQRESAIGPDLSHRRNPNTLKAPFDRLDLSRYHKQTKRICERLAMGWYPLLYGSPGAGKTTLFHNMAQDLGMEFTLISCSKDMFRTEIKGSKNPLSRDYQELAFRNSWENGNSIVVFDEVGLAPGSFLNVLNSGLAQGLILYPDLKRIYKHKTCYIAFADNSNLWGDDSRFPEREDAGSAFRDRIQYIRFEYDGEVCRAYGVWRDPEENGQRRSCIVRSTFVIDKRGKLRHALYGVNPKGHASEVLSLVKQLA